MPAFEDLLSGGTKPVDARVKKSLHEMRIDVASRQPAIVRLDAGCPWWPADDRPRVGEIVRIVRSALRKHEHRRYGRSPSPGTAGALLVVLSLRWHGSEPDGS